MKISNKNKRSVGRPSLRCITVRRAKNHHALNISVSLAKELNLQEGTKVSIKQNGKMYYLSFGGSTGYNIRIKHNGGKTTNAPDTFTCSTTEIVNTLLSLANAEKVAKFMLSAKATEIDGRINYIIIPTPLQVD